MVYPRSLLALSISLLFSCSSSPTPTPPPTDHEVAVASDSDSDEETTPAEGIAAQPLVRLDTTELSPEPNTPIKILLEGTYHKNEVWRGVEAKNWLGVFQVDKGYVLRPAKLQVATVQDPVLDNEWVYSGREVTSADKNALFFITGLKPSLAGNIDTAAFDRTTLAAGKQLTFTLNGKGFHIKAESDSVQLANGEYNYRHYSWTVSGMRNGRKVEQVIAEDEHFDDSIYILLWAGDLDHDGIPDLLLDLSNHYNVSCYALFLSATAAKGKLYQKVAIFEKTGC